MKLPDSLKILNIGGGYALETLAGFKMPPKLEQLSAGQGAMPSIDDIVFPPTLKSLEIPKTRYIS